MKEISPPMILTAILLIGNGVGFWGTGHSVLVIADLFVAIYLLWNSVRIVRDDDDLPPPQHPLVGA